MNARPKFAAIELRPGTTLKLERGRGTQVQVTGGSVWLTQHGDARDYVMRDGDSLTLSGEGTTLISAFAPSSLHIATCERASEPRNVELQLPGGPVVAA